MPDALLGLKCKRTQQKFLRNRNLSLCYLFYPEFLFFILRKLILCLLIDFTDVIQFHVLIYREGKLI